METQTKHTVIVVSDDPSARDGMSDYINAHILMESVCDFVSTALLMNSTFAGRPDMILIDLKTAGVGRESCLHLLKQKFPGCKIVACNVYNGMEKHLKQQGFDEYILREDAEPMERILNVLRDHSF